MTWSVTADSTVVRIPAPSTATTVTSVSPIISAAAVEAVRLGLRTEFALASSPAMPPLRRAGRPTRRVSGLTMCGAARATPTKSARIPMPSSRTTAIVPSPLAKMPTEMAATDAAITTTAVFSEWAAKREGGSVEPSRTAAIGGTRVARSAGTMLASSVIDGAERERDEDRPRREHHPGLREVAAERGQQLGEPEPGEEPDHRGQQPDHQALDHDRAHDLLARGARASAASRTRACAGRP